MNRYLIYVLLIFSFLLPQNVFSQTQIDPVNNQISKVKTMKEANKYTEATQAVVENFFEKTERGDVNGILELMSDDIEWNIPGDESLAPWVGVRKGKTKVLEFFSLHKENTEPLDFRIDKLLVSEEHAVVQSFKKGDEVFGMINFVGHGKAYAEYVAAPASQLALKPKNISHKEAAGATLAALTAWQAFTKNGHLKAGDRLLIHAASGGVGHYAVQIAKYLGAHVIGTSSAANKDFVLSLGADEYLDYRSRDFEKELYNIDFVLETIGGENFSRSLNITKPTGTIINLPSGLTEEVKKKALEKGVKTCFFMMVESSGEDMKQIAELLEKSIIKSHISKTFSFEQMAEAHLQIESGRTVGKIVVTF